MSNNGNLRVFLLLLFVCLRVVQVKFAISIARQICMHALFLLELITVKSKNKHKKIEEKQEKRRKKLGKNME